MEQIALIRPSGEHISQDAEVLTGVDGAPLASVSQAPPLLVSLTLRALSSGPVPARVFADAGKLFAAEVLKSETPSEYVRKTALATGVPISVVATALDDFRELLPRMDEMLDVQRPSGSSAARWVRRGRTLGVVAPSNHPMVHIEWLQALALGYGVAVRPGGRDPFSPRRLARALVAAGLPPDRLAVLPGPHRSGTTLVDEADLGLVYGTDAAVGRYRGSSRVAVRGPGRAKAVVTGEVEWLLEQIAGDGGVRCNNVSAVLCESDHGAVAEELAARLAPLPTLPITSPDAVLPVYAESTAETLRSMLSTVDAMLVSADPLVPLGDGTAVLRPAVVRVDRPDHPALGTELPFPSVWVAPWAGGITQLRDSLAVLLPADVDPAVLQAALDEPSIRAVVCGDHGDWWANPLLPHDGYLGQFLMESRGALLAVTRW